MQGASTRAIVATLVVALSGSDAFGALIRDSVMLRTTGQSMWDSGPEAVFSGESFLGVKWGTYDGGAPDRVAAGGIVGDENTRVPGTGGTIPNPARLAWDAAMATCRLTSSFTTCVNGTPAVRTCLPSWLGGGCTTVIPRIPGLGTAPPAEIDNPLSAVFVDTRTGLEGGLDTSGEVGVIPWVEASGGAISADFGFESRIIMPDHIIAGDLFTVSSSISVLGDRTSIVAEAPSFKAGVDGLLNTENDLFGTACVIAAGCTAGTSPLDITPGRFGIISIDTTEDNFLRVGGGTRGEGSLGVPGIGFDKVYEFYVPTPENPDGVDDEVTPKKTPSPRMGDFTVSNPEDKSGGTVSGNEIDFTTNQRLLSLNASLTGLGELAVGSPGILSNKVGIVPLIDIQYTILDVGVGPRFGVQQDFHLDPRARVRLEFDKPVLLEGLLGDVETTAFDFELGSSVSLRFAGEVGKLVRREFYMEDADFTNKTGLTIDPGMKVEIGCIELLDFGGCLLREDYATTGLANIKVFEETWKLRGFNTVAFLGDAGTLPGEGDGDGGGDGETPVSEPPVAVLFASALGLLVLGARSRSRAGPLSGTWFRGRGSARHLTIAA